MKTTVFTAEELSKFPKATIEKMYLELLESFNTLKKQLDTIQNQNDLLNRNLQIFQEQIAILTQQKFGRKTETAKNIPSGQVSFLDILPDSLKDFFNEAEAASDNTACSEPEMETVVYKRRKTKGKRDKDLSGVEVVVDPTISLPDSVLKERFPYGYTRLEDEVHRELEYIPAKFLVHEIHIAVYAGKKDTGIIKADRPDRLLTGSIITPSLAAGIIDAKYVNHIPLNRLSEDFRRSDVILSRQTLAKWMIKLTERYFRVIYDRMHNEILKCKLISCDETPFCVINNGRSSKSKDYMWVYHSSQRCGGPPIYMYDYHDGNRNTQALKEFLKGYKGILMTDGFQVYHTASRERPDELKVAGCWAHAKRRYADQVKALGAGNANGTIADEGNKRISAIFHVDNMYKDKSDEDRLKNRQDSVKPLVDAYFEWVKKTMLRPDVDKGSNVYKALSYSVNQEQFLREFLDNPIIPLDNNDAERSIKNFCVAKHSWHVIGTKSGAKSSAMLYSIAETAKANNLKTYEYFKYLLEEILKHQDDNPREYLDDLMPWSETLPQNCRNIK